MPPIDPTPINGNPDAGNEPKAGSGFPGLKQQVLISWVFIIASVTLLLGFVMLQLNIHNPNSYFAIWPNVGNVRHKLPLAVGRAFSCCVCLCAPL